MHKLTLVFISFLILASCRNGEEVKEQADLKMVGDTMLIAEKSPLLNHLIIQKTDFQDYSAEFRTTGTVRPVSGRMAGIAPPFSGRIMKSHIVLGQKVRAGSPVFELSSPEFYEASKAYFAALSTNELCQIKYQRQKELAANGVASQKDLEEAKSEADISSQELEQARAVLKMYNMDAGSLQLGNSLVVTSPIAGEIVENTITIGSYVNEDSEPLAVVADLSYVWVAALVKEKYFGSVREGSRAEISTIANKDKITEGVVHYVGKILDDETRSIEVIVECKNADLELKPGMFCEVRFIGTPVKSIILPSTAIMKAQDNDYVIIEVSRGRYYRRIVETETVNLKEVLVSSGLNVGENVVISGGIYFNL